MTDNSELADTGVPSQFERNRYFDGKLLTARDMIADQAYHRGRLQAIVRATLGVGIVTGLEVTAITTEDDRLKVTVQPGVALDAAGRPVIVPPATGEVTVRAPGTDRPFDANEIDVDGLELRLRFDACATERVPVAGSEHVTGDGGEHGRVVESFVIEAHTPTMDASGDPIPPKPVPDVSVTKPDDAPEFDRGPSTVPLVLAWVKKIDTSKWSITMEDRPLVYPTDLVYATATTHATDRENPHNVNAKQVNGVVASVGGATPANDGAIDVRAKNGPLSVSTSGSELVFDSDAIQSVSVGETAVQADANGGVTLTSSDGSVGITADLGNNAVNLTATSLDENQFLHELGGLNEHNGKIDLVSKDGSVDVTTESNSKLNLEVSDNFKKELYDELKEEFKEEIMTEIRENLKDEIITELKEKR